MSINKVATIILAFNLSIWSFAFGARYQSNKDARMDKLYQVEATVMGHFDNETLFQDFNGDEWVIDKDETFAKGQKVILTLNDQGTIAIEDDEITEVR